MAEKIMTRLNDFVDIKQVRNNLNAIKHVYIKPRSPQLNGKVERSHRTDQEESYQLLTYTGDVDLNEKLAEWERFYNIGRPHGAFKGETAYEALRCILE
jgi:transposase InsO family protein